MAQKFQLEIQPPLGGVVRRSAYQKQEPFTCYDSLNFWPVDAKTSRQVLATRPGLEAQTTPGGSVVTLLCPVNGVSTNNPYQSMIGGFGGHLYYWSGTSWTAATGAGADSIATTRAVYGSPFLTKAYISQTSAKPLEFDYATGEVATLTESAGTAPSDMRMFQAFQGALWGAGRLAEPHILYASKTGDATDWNFGQNNTGSAFFTGTDEFEGLLNGPITAIAAHTSDSMIVSTLERLMVLRGHPLRGGIFEAIDFEQYILGQGAWCVTPGGVMYFMTPIGLMALPPEAGAVPARVSKNKIPGELIGLLYNYENPTIAMAYDTRWNAIHITNRGTNEQGWTYFLEAGAFCPQEYDGYPHVMLEFKPFISDSTSGVMFGGAGYGGLALHDTFGDEEFPSSVTIGPVPISDSPMRKSRVDKMRFVFGRDTPTDEVEGKIRVCCGTDGQDAVNRLLILDRGTTHEEDLTTVGNNNGTLYPHISGHAMAIQISQAAGSLTVEGIQAEVTSAGDNRQTRSEQLPVDGEETNFADPSSDFDGTIWEGYSEATPDAPSCNLPGFTHLVDLADLPSAWWQRTEHDGRDIRATDDDNNPVPMDLIEFDRSATTGLVAVKLNQQTTPRAVRLWVGNPNTGAPTVTSEFGQYNAYDSNWKGFYPNAAGNDRTRSQEHLTPTAQTTPGDVTGPIGNTGTDFDGVTRSAIVAITDLPTALPATIITAAKFAGTELTNNAVGLTGGATTQTLSLRGNYNATSDVTSSTAIHANTTEEVITSDTVSDTVPDWHHHAAVFTSTASRSAFIDGAGKQTNTDTLASPTATHLIVGRGGTSGVPGTSINGALSLVQVHGIARPDCWIAYQAAMMDQVEFWNGWGDFVQVNQPTVDTPLVTACPTGIVPVTETGTWSGYDQATPIATIAAFEKNWTHLIDLSRLSADWWNAVSSTGVDIRATDQDNLFIPFDLIEFDATAETGLAAVRITQTQDPQPIRLWVGNATAVTVPACAAYGQYFAYDEDWIGFWPKGGGDDRTQYQHDLTATSDDPNTTAPDVGAATGPIGNTATAYDGEAQYSLGSTIAAAQASPNTPLALVAAVKLADDFDPDYGIGSPNAKAFRKQVSIGMYTASPISSIVLEHTNGSARARIGARSEDLRLGSTWSDDLTDLDTWRHYAGIARNSVQREVYVDGGNGDESSANRLATPVHNLEKIILGAVFDGSENVSYLNGTLSLVSLHRAIRNEDWAEYQFKMFNQATFWESDWTWTTSSSTLPQS